MYPDVFKNLTGSFLNQDEEALYGYLGNLTRNLVGDLLQNVSTFPPSKISNPDIMFLLLRNLLEPTGLSPLISLLLTDAPVNVSTVLDLASKLIFASNETDPAMLDFEQLIKQFLSLEGNLTLPISYVMGYSLLNYFEYFSLDDVIILAKSIQPFTNQSNQISGLIETILSAIELWKTVMDSPINNPANITLAYLQQVRVFGTSLFQSNESEFSGVQLNTTQFNQISEDTINFLSPESLKDLTEVGPDTALNIVIQKVVGLLPLEVQQPASPLSQAFIDIGSKISECATSPNCSTQVSDIFSLLNQTVDMMSSSNANFTLEMLSNKTIVQGSDLENITSVLLSLILSHSNEIDMRTLNCTLQFIRRIMATSNISLSEIQNALEQSNLTLEELTNIAALAQAVNISGLLDDLLEIYNAAQCFEQQLDSAETAKCVMELTEDISSFLSHLPYFHNRTAILLQIPLAINKTISDFMQINFSSSPNVTVLQTFYSTIANVKKNLQLNQLTTPEITRELDMVEELMQLFSNIKEPFNSTLMMDPIDAQKLYLEIMEWYLKRLENITSNSSFSELIQPFFCITQMQITLQLAQTDFSSYFSDQYKLLMNSLQYPIDDTGLSKIGTTVVDVLQHLSDLITFELGVQNASYSELLNKTVLNATEQIKQYIDLIQKWTTQPYVSLALTNLLRWGNSSMNVSTQIAEELLDDFDVDNQVANLSVIDNTIQSLRNALTLAKVPGGLQSDDFLDAILDVLRNAMQLWTGGTEDMPVSTKNDILDVVRDSLQVIVQPGMSFASSRNISLLILKTTEKIIQQTAPDVFGGYIIYGLKIVTTYFDNTSTADAPHDWSEM